MSGVVLPLSAGLFSTGVVVVGAEGGRGVVVVDGGGTLITTGVELTTGRGVIALGAVVVARGAVVVAGVITAGELVASPAADEVGRVGVIPVLDEGFCAAGTGSPLVLVCAHVVYVQTIPINMATVTVRCLKNLVMFSF